MVEFCWLGAWGGQIRLLNTNLVFKEINSSILINNAYASIISAYSENGVAYVMITLKAGLSGIKEILTVKDPYIPRKSVFGNYAPVSSMNDMAKYIYSSIDSAGICKIRLTEDGLTAPEYLTFMYPIKMS